MNLSLFEKFGVIGKFIFSSFLSLEMFILSVLLFAILVVNLKRGNKIIQMISVGIYIGFVLGIVASYTTYVKTCVDSFVRSIMNYVYFPSTVVYFFIMVFVTIMMIISLFKKDMTLFKRIFNFAFFSVLYFFFMAFIALATYDMVDLMDITVLYKNNVILSLVQISNLILLIWIVFTCFYHLYLFFKRRYD